MEQTRASQSPVRCQRGARGNVTLIVLLALFSMLALGLLALRGAHEGVSRAGNTRWSKQARQVAEMGLYHAMALFQQRGDLLFRQRRLGEWLELKSSGRLAFLTRDDDGLFQEGREIPVGQLPALIDGPRPLGELQALVPSYRVRIESTQPAQPPPGNELNADSAGVAGPFYCLVHFLAVGYVASAPLPDQLSLQTRLAMEHFSESRIHASITLGPFSAPCAQ